MLWLLLALHFFGTVFCYTINVSPNRYINENARSKRSIYKEGIPIEDYGRYMEYMKGSANVKRSARSLVNNIGNEKNGAGRPIPGPNTTPASSRWDITDILLNRDQPANDGPNFKYDNWDINDILLNRFKTSNQSNLDKIEKEEERQAYLNNKHRDLSSEDLDKMARVSIKITPGTVKTLKYNEITNSLYVDDPVRRARAEEDNNESRRLILNQNDVNKDDFKDLDIIEHLTNEYYQSKHTEAKSMQREMPRKNRNRRDRRFNLSHDLLQAKPPKDHVLIARENLVSSMVKVGSSEDLLVQPAPYEFQPVTNEEHQCTTASEGK